MAPTWHPAAGYRSPPTAVVLSLAPRPTRLRIYACDATLLVLDHGQSEDPGVADRDAAYAARFTAPDDLSW